MNAHTSVHIWIGKLITNPKFLKIQAQKCLCTNVIVHRDQPIQPTLDLKAGTRECTKISTHTEIETAKETTGTKFQAIQTRKCFISTCFLIMHGPFGVPALSLIQP